MLKEKIVYEAVILAGGLSSRAEGFKPLFKIGNSTLIQRAVTPFIPLCSRIIVVTGYRGDEVAKALNNYPKVEIVHNEDYLHGMFSSVKCGVSKVKGDRFFITPGDYPFIHEELCRKLQEVQGEVVVPSYNYKKGHPILLSSSVKDEIIKGENKTLRDILKKKKTTYVTVDNRDILIDIDTKEDFLQSCNRIREGC